MTITFSGHGMYAVTYDNEGELILKGLGIQGLCVSSECYKDMNTDDRGFTITFRDTV